MQFIEIIFQNPFNNELFWKFSNSLTFPWLLPFFEISLTKIEIPWLFPDLEKKSFSRLFSLTVATLY